MLNALLLAIAIATAAPADIAAADAAQIVTCRALARSNAQLKVTADYLAGSAAINLREAAELHRLANGVKDNAELARFAHQVAAQIEKDARDLDHVAQGGNAVAELGARQTSGACSGR